MSHILLISSQITGVMNPILGLAHYLQADGHKITFASPYEIGPTVKARGFDYVQLPPIIRDRYAKSYWRIRGSKRDACLSNAASDLGVANFAETLADINPDLLLIDIELHGHVMVAHQASVKTVLLVTWFSIWKTDGIPPLHTDIIPAEGFGGSRLGLDLAWRRYWVWRWLRNLYMWIRDSGLYPLTQLRALADQIGFPFRTEAVPYMWLIPCSYKTLPMMVLNGWELEFPHKPRPDTHYVGPMLQLGRRELAIDELAHQQIKSLYPHGRGETPGKSLVYCAISSHFAADIGFVFNVIHAFRQRPAWTLILSVGKKLDVSKLGELPENVHAFPWVPQLDVLAHADAVISHGGANTINECIHFGVPLLIYSGKNVDQNGNAARVAYHKIGIRADKDRDSANEIERNLDELLTDPQYKTNVVKMGGDFKRYRAEKRAEALVQTLLEEG